MIVLGLRALDKILANRNIHHNTSAAKKANITTLQNLEPYDISM